MESEKGPFEHSYEKQPEHHAPIDMTNRKDSIAFQEAAELYGDAETAESACRPKLASAA